MSEGTLWAKALAKAFRTWCERNQINPWQQFNYYGVAESKWGHMIRGENLLSEIEVYARIYRHTRLPQANPTTIPPLVTRTPSGGESIRERAWTQEEYLLWESTQGSAIGDVGSTADQLLNLLSPYMNAKAEQRDELMLKHGVVLRSLWIDLNTLVQPKEERERNIAMNQSMQQVGRK